MPLQNLTKIDPSPIMHLTVTEKSWRRQVSDAQMASFLSNSFGDRPSF